MNLIYGDGIHVGQLNMEQNPGQDIKFRGLLNDYLYFPLNFYWTLYVKNNKILIWCLSSWKHFELWCKYKKCNGKVLLEVIILPLTKGVFITTEVLHYLYYVFVLIREYVFLL